MRNSVRFLQMLDLLNRHLGPEAIGVREEPKLHMVGEQLGFKVGPDVYVLAPDGERAYRSRHVDGHQEFAEYSYGRCIRRHASGARGPTAESPELRGHIAGAA